jgi:hypothetical protein
MYYFFSQKKFQPNFYINSCFPFICQRQLATKDNILTSFSLIQMLENLLF